MNAKELSQKGYDLFNAGDMESFFNDIVDDNITWTFSQEGGIFWHLAEQRAEWAFQKLWPFGGTALV